MAPWVVMVRALQKSAAASALLLLAACAPAPPDPSPVLREVGEELQRAQLRDNPWLQDYYQSEERSMPDLGLVRAEERAAMAQRLHDRLAVLDPETLEHEDWLTFESLRWDLGLIAEEPRFYWHGFQLAPYTFNALGAHLSLEDPHLETEEEARRYLALVADYLGFLEQLQTRLAGQLDREIVMPRPALDAAIESWKGRVENPVTVFPALAEGVEELPPGAPSAPQVVDGFREELARRVEDEVVPAWRRLIAFLEGPYREAAPAEGGLARVPGGSDYYRHLVRLSVTLDMPPEEIHELGLRRLEETSFAMAEIRRGLGFAGDAREFQHHLEADPRFYAETPEEVEARLLAHVEAIEPRIDELFARRPRAPYRVARLDPVLEAGLTYGYYQGPTLDDDRGTYYYNGSKLDQRSMIGAASLIFHELVPGHHFQQALQLENDRLTRYRRDAFHDAFVEGWGQYASLLAAELGMYEDPYDLYGWLADESFYYSRLVVDTGLNHHGWTRHRASDFMRANTLASETEIETEVLRYSTDIPGQALAYALGALKILGLREAAREALGDGFDVRRFHSAVLDHGSMPLAVLERQVERFIEEEKKR